MKFNKLKINKKIIRVLDESGYKEATPIQEKTIPHALERKDVLGLAQTGSGKTAAFAIPSLQHLMHKEGSKRIIKVLVVTPTRELAIQVQESFKTYGKYLPLKSAVVFGGVNQSNQVRELRTGVDILVATPGRLLDLISQKLVDISKVDTLILDEADRMLDMGFVHDINKIVKLIPTNRQTLLFSATMPKEIESIAAKYLVDPVTVSVTPVSSTVDTIKQGVYFVDKIYKTSLLLEFFSEHKNDPVLIFTRTKHGADKLLKDLTKLNIKAKAIHGNKSQNARQLALSLFKTGKINALIATDIAARGIDINELKYVINYDMPEQAESYVHRIGRTGRAGNSGTAISYCSYQEMSLLREIEKLIKMKIDVLENTRYPMVDKTEKPKKESRASKRTRPTKEKTKPSDKTKINKSNSNTKGNEQGRFKSINKPKSSKQKNDRRNRYRHRASV